MRSVKVQYANPQNAILAAELHKDFVPEKGELMTRLELRGRTVWEIVIVNPEQDDLLLRECRATPFDKTLPHGHQTWRIEPDPMGQVIRVSKRKDNKWHQWRKLTSIFIPGSRYYYPWT